jgi:hypothetical protein
MCATAEKEIPFPPSLNPLPPTLQRRKEGTAFFGRQNIPGEEKNGRTSERGRRRGNSYENFTLLRPDMTE